MNVPNVEKPTKKAFHFPKSARGKGVALEEAAAQQSAEVERTPAKKLTQAKRVSAPKAQEVA
ncbi:hypothetical protein PQQ50_35455, partial [Paraburkholderia graminis]